MGDRVGATVEEAGVEVKVGSVVGVVLGATVAVRFEVGALVGVLVNVGVGAIVNELDAYVPIVRHGEVVCR